MFRASRKERMKIFIFSFGYQAQIVPVKKIDPTREKSQNYARENLFCTRENYQKSDREKKNAREKNQKSGRETPNVHVKKCKKRSKNGFHAHFRFPPQKKKKHWD